MCYLAVFFVVLYLFRKHGTQLCYETLQIYTNYQRPLHSGISRLSNVPSVQSLKKCYLGIHTSVFLYVPIVMTVQRLYEDFLKIFLDFAHMQKAMLSFGLISSILQFLHAKFKRSKHPKSEIRSGKEPSHRFLEVQLTIRSIFD